MSRELDLRALPAEGELRLERGQAVRLDSQLMGVEILDGSLVLQGLAEGGGVRHLLTLRAGALAYAAPLPAAVAAQLIAVAATPATLRMLPADAWAAAPREGQVERYLASLLEVAASLGGSPPAAPGAGQGLVQLAAGGCWRPPAGAPVQVRVVAGAVDLLGLVPLSPGEAAPALPLSTDGWLVARSEAVLQVDAELAPDQLAAGLGWVLAAVLAAVAQAEAQAAEATRTAVAGRAARAEQVTEEALARIAAVLEGAEEATGPVAGSGDLLSALAAIGQAMGVPVRRPLKADEGSRDRSPVDPIARASRLRTRRVVFEPGWWRRDSGPVLALRTEDKRFVAMLPRSTGGYEILDPDREGRKRLDAAEAEKYDMGLVFYPSLPPARVGAADLLRLGLGPHMGDLAATLLWGAAAALTTLLTPIAVGLVMGQAIPGGDRTLLLQLALALVAAAGGGAVFQLVQGQALSRIEALGTARAQAGLVGRALELGLPYFRGYQAGEVLSQILTVERLRRTLGGATVRTLFTSGLAALNIALMLAYSPAMTLVALALVLPLIAVTAGVARGLGRREGRLQELDGRLGGLLVQLIGGMAKLRVAGAEERAFGQWARGYAEKIRLEHELQGLTNVATISNSALPPLGTAALFVVAVTLLQGDGGPNVGTFLAFLAAFGQFTAGAVQLSNLLVDAVEVKSLVAHMRPLLDTPPEAVEGAADPGRLSGRLAVQSASFRYQPEGPLILDGVDIRAEPGEYIALVGPSGSGKSTVLRLLLGFEHPEAGQVRYDGRDLGELDLGAVRRQMGVVMQSTRMASGSVLDFISGVARVSLDEAWAAARAAGFEADLRAMPMGLHTIVSEGGSNLSGGQRQRLLIARALVRKPPLLLFDEATSALDSETQEQVSRSLEALSVTRIAVAHRLSTVRSADRIYVLVGGRVEQVGSFDELAAEQGGHFQKLMARQSL